MLGSNETHKHTTQSLPVSHGRVLTSKKRPRSHRRNPSLSFRRAFVPAAPTVFGFAGRGFLKFPLIPVSVRIRSASAAAAGRAPGRSVHDLHLPEMFLFQQITWPPPPPPTEPLCNPHMLIGLQWEQTHTRVFYDGAHYNCPTTQHKHTTTLMIGWLMWAVSLSACACVACRGVVRACVCLSSPC